MSLKGMDIMTGGSMIIPMDMSVEATTISMMMNGMKRSIPILKATVSSLSTKAGMSTNVGTSLSVFGFGSYCMFMKSLILS